MKNTRKRKTSVQTRDKKNSDLLHETGSPPVQQDRNVSADYGGRSEKTNRLPDIGIDVAGPGDIE